MMAVINRKVLVIFLLAAAGFLLLPTFYFGTSLEVASHHLIGRPLPVIDPTQSQPIGVYPVAEPPDQLLGNPPPCYTSWEQWANDILDGWFDPPCGTTEGRNAALATGLTQKKIDIIEAQGAICIEDPEATPCPDQTATTRQIQHTKICSRRTTDWQDTDTSQPIPNRFKWWAFHSCPVKMEVIGLTGYLQYYDWGARRWKTLHLSGAASRHQPGEDVDYIKWTSRVGHALPPFRGINCRRVKVVTYRVYYEPDAPPDHPGQGYKTWTIYSQGGCA